MNTEKQVTGSRDELLALFDVGTFSEIGAHIRRKDGADTYDAVICGYGSVEGKLVFAFAQDSSRTNGALDAVGADKLERLYAQALRSGAPVVGMFDSAGAVVYDGSIALTSYGRFMRCVSEASGIVPQIALVKGACVGMSAVVAAMFDLTVTIPDVSELYVAGGDKANGTGSKASALVAEDAAGAVGAVRSLLNLLPANNRDTADIDPADDPNRPVDPACLASGGDSLCAALADDGQYLPLYSEYAPGMTTALCRIGGRTVGLVANDPAVDDGRLSADGAKKAAHLVSFCDAFSLPVVTLVNCPGIGETADPALAPALGRLACAYLEANTARVSAVVGAAYGAGFTLMGSRALGADVALATPDAVISVLDPASAVAFVWNDRITADKSRTQVEEEWKRTQASPEVAAANGDIDDIVPGDELRARLCAALYMLAGKADGMPERRHSVLPL